VNKAGGYIGTRGYAKDNLVRFQCCVPSGSGGDPEPVDPSDPPAPPHPPPNAGCVKKYQASNGSPCKSGFIKWLPAIQGHFLTGNNLVTKADVTVEECKGICWVTRECASIDFEYTDENDSIGKCFVNKAGGRVGSRNYDKDNLINYQCCEAEGPEMPEPTTSTTKAPPQTTAAPVVPPKTTAAPVVSPKTTAAPVPKTTTAAVVPPVEPTQPAGQIFSSWMSSGSWISSSYVTEVFVSSFELQWDTSYDDSGAGHDEDLSGYQTDPIGGWVSSYYSSSMVIRSSAPWVSSGVYH
jgi:hypothetical protein